MWRCLAASVTGPSHAKSGAPCQDSQGTRVLTRGGQETLIACVADGAGSAAKSDDGSSLACVTILELATEFFEKHEGSLEKLDRETAVGWCQEARERLAQLAEKREDKLRDYATTLCVAILGPEKAAFFQVGDGAIVARRTGVMGVVFWPQSGEYANSTTFLTIDQVEQHVEFCEATAPYDDLALFTDGIERLALSFEGQTPHPPFFEPLFKTLRSAPDPDALSAELAKFLDSESMRNRSDDDKTVILAAQTAAR